MITFMLMFFLNACFWVAVHFASGFLVHIIPASFYTIKNPLFSLWAEKYEGYVYRHVLRINSWKDKLPEAGTFFKIHPFSKKKLTSLSSNYIERFILETCRAEFAHVLPMLLYPLCLFWNPWPGNLIMALYAIVANVPFVIIQRFNRIRLMHLLVLQRKYETE